MDPAPEQDSVGADAPKRERAIIQFPYIDLDDAIAIANTIRENAGLSCTLDQLAAYTIGQ